MRRIRGRVVALMLACAAMQVQAGETDVRATIARDTLQMVKKEQFRALEERYAAAVASSERTPSGGYVSYFILREMVPRHEDPQMYQMSLTSFGYVLGQWALQFPDSLLVALGKSRVSVDIGWIARGDGYARTVTRDAYSRFELSLQRAHDVLMTQEKAGRKDPNWYVQMIFLSRDQGWDRQRSQALLDDAIRAFPDNFLIYTAFATRLVPRWGGSREALAKFAAFAVEKSRATEGESMYAQIYWTVMDSLDVELSDPDVDWNRINAGFEDLIRRYPDPWNLNHHAMMACAARDMPTTRRILLRIKDKVEPRAWDSRAHYLRCVDAAGLRREQLQ